MTSRPFAFLCSSSSVERRALAASGLGWMLDGMDVTLYAMVIPALESEYRLSAGGAGLLASATLISSAVGGILFGWLADRAGRRLALIASVLVYSVFTAACGLSQSVNELVIFRALLGLGVGGQWAAGAALVAETWRPEHRGKAIGLMQSGFAVGYGLAAAVAALVLPRWGWRAVFFTGLFPALLAIWIRRGISESPAWIRTRRSNPLSDAATIRPEAEGALAAQPHYRSLIIRTLLMNAAALFAWWGLFTWIPSYLALPADRGGRGLSLTGSAEWIALMQAGMWLGYVTFGFIGDRFSARRTYMAYLLGASVLVPLYARAASDAALLVLGPLLAFFGTGHFTGFGVIAAGLFPTRFRASAMGLTYNFGRGLSAAAPWALGALASRWSFSIAFSLSAAGFLLAALLAAGLPRGGEQFGRETVPGSRAMARSIG
jgi:MFS family permease